MSAILLLAVHFVGDFLLQSNWMALNKSKRWDALALHVAVYSSCFLLWGWRFALVTAGLHCVTDAVTSRITSRLWFVEARGFDELPRGAYLRFDDAKRHWFFVAIGADQLIHAACLIWTLEWVMR